jgi:hypothetical protein
MEDWAADVRKHVPDADSAVIARIVRYCGIALQKRDAELDSAINAVEDRMKGDRSRNRVTVYYLLAEHFGKLSAFT